MAHRIWKEAKQLPGTAGPGNMLGCSLIFFPFLWAIHPIRPVELAPSIAQSPPEIFQSQGHGTHCRYRVRARLLPPSVPCGLLLRPAAREKKAHARARSSYDGRLSRRLSISPPPSVTFDLALIEMAFAGPFTKEGCPFCPLFSMDRTMATLMGHSSAALSTSHHRRHRARPISCCSYHPTNKGR